MEQSIDGLLKVSLDNLKEMTGVDTIIGKAINLGDEQIAIPISKVKMSFASGGTETKQKDANPFGGGTGGMVSITPVAFLTLSNNEIRILHLEEQTHLLENLIEETPNIIKMIKNEFLKKE